MQSQWRLLARQCESSLNGFVLTSDGEPAWLVSPSPYGDFTITGDLDVTGGAAVVKLGLPGQRPDEDCLCQVIVRGRRGEVRPQHGPPQRFTVAGQFGPLLHIDVSSHLLRVWVNGYVVSELMMGAPVVGFVSLGAVDGEVCFRGLQVRYRDTAGMETISSVIPDSAAPVGPKARRSEVMFVKYGQGSIGYLHHAPKVLTEAGITFRMFGFVDARKASYVRVVEEIVATDPQLVVLECLCEPADLGPTLAREFPRVKFVSLCHSDIQTMPFERDGRGSTVLDELLKRARLSEDVPNYAIAAGRRQQAELLTAILGVPCVCLPHPVAHRIAPSPRRRAGPNLGISLFGRHRILKNVHAQVAAVAYYQRKSGRDVTLYYNAPHREADPGLLALIEATHLTTQAVGWLEVDEFERFCAEHIDIGLQCSFSETFNYTALDQMSLGIPVICSAAIEYASRRNQVMDFTDYLELARRIGDAVDNYEQFSKSALEDAAAAKARQNRGFVESLRDQIDG